MGKSQNNAYLNYILFLNIAGYGCVWCILLLIPHPSKSANIVKCHCYFFSSISGKGWGVSFLSVHVNEKFHPSSEGNPSVVPSNLTNIQFFLVMLIFFYSFFSPASCLFVCLFVPGNVVSSTNRNLCVCVFVCLLVFFITAGYLSISAIIITRKLDFRSSGPTLLFFLYIFRGMRKDMNEPW